MANRKIWQILLMLWFALWGLLELSNFEFVFSGVILGLLALGIALFLLLDR